MLNSIVFGETVNPDEMTDRGTHRIYPYTYRHIKDALYGRVYYNGFYFKLNYIGESHSSCM